MYVFVKYNYSIIRKLKIYIIILTKDGLLDMRLMEGSVEKMVDSTRN